LDRQIQMKPGIHIAKVWADDDVVELRILVADGTSYFTNMAYVGHADLKNAVSTLHTFKDHVHGGLCDLRLGEFGPEYASGAFHARFRLSAPGRVFVSCEQESEFVEFAKKEVASRATMYVKSEPALLDRFIAELRAVSVGSNEEAYLEVV
jgi:hypothetical protein